MNLDNERKAFEDWAKKETCWDLYWSENIDQYMDHQTNGAWLSWQASANRQGYKLVPVEPTDVKLKEFQKIWLDSGCAHIMKKKTALDLYKAMIGACDDYT